MTFVLGNHRRHHAQLLFTPLILASALFTNTATAVLDASPPAKSPTVDQKQVTHALAGLAVPFEANQGQADPKVAFQARTLAGPLFVTKDGALVWSLAHPQAKPARNFVGPPAPKAPSYAVVERFVGGQAKPTGAVPSPTQVSYFHGNERGKWHTGVPTWQRIGLGQVWPGVEVSLAAHGNNAEKLFTVAPGADASTIALEVAGGTLAVESSGALRVENAGQSLVTFSAPVAWQDMNGTRQSVQVAYRLAGDKHDRYGFALGVHDKTQPVFIDPLVQSTYLGGGNSDWANALAVTSTSVYVAGNTQSVDFPGTSGGAQPANTRNGDAFVAQLSLDLKTLSQATYLGGSDGDDASSLAVTSTSVYVAGATRSIDFPGTSGGAQEELVGAYDAFVAQLSLDLRTLHQATYLDGPAFSVAFALAVTSTAVYVAGYTGGELFPGTIGGAQAAFGGGNHDAFVAKLSLDLKTIEQATYLGGSSDDSAFALAVTNTAVYVAGSTDSIDFPGLGHAPPGGFNAFVAQLSLDLTHLGQTTYLGGSSDDSATALAVTSTAIYVAGDTQSTDFFGTSGGAQGVHAPDLGGTDAFVARLTLDLAMWQATYLGGFYGEFASALAVTSTAVYVAGQTSSPNFPGTNGGAQAMFGSGDNPFSDNDAFAAKLSLDLKTLSQATYLGGSSDDYASALAVTSAAVYVAGVTTSTDFPGTSGGAQEAYDRNHDAFVAQLTPDLKGATLTVTQSGTGSGTVTSSPEGIDCGPTCSVTFESGESVVTLTAAAASGSVFTGWTGDCTGTALTCTLNITKDATVTATFSQAPDFVVTGLVLPTIPIVNGTFSAVVTVKNQGAAAGDPGLLRVWANQPTAQACAATGGDKFVTVGILAAGASKTLTVSGLPSGVAGFKTLRTFVDAVCATAESNEANNQLAQGYSVGQPDFVITAMTLTPAQPAANSSFNALITVKNQGALLGDGGLLRVWANQPTAQSCPSTEGDQFTAVGILAAGASTTLTVGGLPAGAAGAKTLRAFVDAACTRSESNETNNQRTLAYTVVPPDFVITGITLTPATSAANGPFNATITVKNQGVAAGNGGLLRVWTNQPTAQSCAAAGGDQSIAVGTLAAGASKSLTVGLTAGAAGTKTLRAFVDAGCATGESSETNNQSTKAYTAK